MEIFDEILSTASEERSVKDAEYSRMRKERDKVSKLLTLNEIPHKIYNLGSYKLRTAVDDIHPNDLDVAIVLKDEPDNLKGMKDRVLRIISNDLAIRKYESISKSVKNPVIALTYKNKDNEEKFHIDMAIFTESNGQRYILWGKYDTFKHKANNSIEMNKHFAAELSEHNDTENLRYFIKLLKIINTSLTKNTRKNASIPSVVTVSMAIDMFTNRVSMLENIINFYGKLLENHHLSYILPVLEEDGFYKIQNDVTCQTELRNVIYSFYASLKRAYDRERPLEVWEILKKRIENLGELPDDYNDQSINSHHAG